MKTAKINRHRLDVVLIPEGRKRSYLKYKKKCQGL